MSNDFEPTGKSRWGWWRRLLPLEVGVFVLCLLAIVAYPTLRSAVYNDCTHSFSLTGLCIVPGPHAKLPAGSLSGQWSKPDCDWAILTLIDGESIDSDKASAASAARQVATAAWYVGVAHSHGLELQAAWTHCGRGASGYIDPTPSDVQAVASLKAERQTHIAATAWYQAHGQPAAVPLEQLNVTLYDRLIGLFQTGRCIDKGCNFNITITLPKD